MITYITAFIFYTLAMVGVMLIGFVIYKKTFLPLNKDENRGMIKILDRLNISPKKTLMVVKIKNEKFLIASDLERTTFLAKLEDENNKIKVQNIEPASDEIEYENRAQAKLEKIQEQFRELYSKNEDENPENKKEDSKPQRKELIRQLLKDLNETPTNIESKH